MTLRVGIVGAGPAGIMAALKAAAQGAVVHLYDTNQAVGRKLTVAGNGRCNLSNADLRSEVYASDAPDALAAVLRRYGYLALLADLEGLGIYTYATPDGWTYPVSNSGAAVVEILAVALEQAGVQVRLMTKVTGLRLLGGPPPPPPPPPKATRTSPGGGEAVVGAGPRHGFALELGHSPQRDVHDRVIIAAGGIASEALGSRGDCLPMLARLGHTLLPVRPALAPLTGDMRSLQKLQGVRLDVALRLYADGALLGESLGNLMFTQGGLSGPAPMDLAHLVSGNLDAALEARIDLVPAHAAQLDEALALGQARNTPAAVALMGFMPPKLPPVLLRLAGLAEDARLGEVDRAALARLRQQVHGLAVQVTGTRPLSQSQLSTGGVPLAEVEPATMESRVVPGLYLAGELLNVIGPCGGYNLHWAWASGAVAGRAAGAESGPAAGV